MISTVTSSTVAVITAASAITSLATALSLIAILAFIVLIIQKEVFSSGTSRWSHSLSRGLNIGIVPLGLAFVMIAAAQLLRVLN